MLRFLEEHMLACSLKGLTGLDCPGCGMQRAFLAFLKGEFLQSLVLQPALFPLLFTLLFTLVHLRLKFVFGPRLIVVFFLLSLSLMIVNWVVKLAAHF
jgi:hypothetical protein